MFHVIICTSIGEKMIIDCILGILSDGEWHNINELERQFIITKEKLKLLLDFLKKYSFIEIINNKVRLTEEVYSLLKELKY